MTAELAERLFETLREAGFDGIGITRECYADSESRALDIVEAGARRLELTTERDAAANLWVTLPGTEPSLPFAACGSHIDTVPQGGNFDGAAGVVGGLMALAALRSEAHDPRHRLAWRGKRVLRTGLSWFVRAVWQIDASGSEPDKRAKRPPPVGMHARRRGGCGADRARRGSS
jgi:hypothetical protein